MVTSGISRSAGIRSFEDPHRDMICIRVFIGVSVRACVNVLTHFSRIFLGCKRRSRRQQAPVVTSGIFRSAGVQFFGGPHRDRVCIRVFIGVSVRACVSVLAPFSGIFLGCKRRSRRQRGTSGDFGNLQIYQCSVLRRRL